MGSQFSSHSYGTSLVMWDHTVLPANRHKWTRPALTPDNKLVLDLPTPEGWKAELTYRLPGYALAESRTRDLSITSPTPYHYTTEPTRKHHCFLWPVYIVVFLQIFCYGIHQSKQFILSLFCTSLFKFWKYDKCLVMFPLHQPTRVFAVFFFVSYCCILSSRVSFQELSA